MSWANDASPVDLIARYNFSVLQWQGKRGKCWVRVASGVVIGPESGPKPATQRQSAVPNQSFPVLAFVYRFDIASNKSRSTVPRRLYKDKAIGNSLEIQSLGFLCCNVLWKRTV
jgi:hypothetical protein